MIQWSSPSQAKQYIPESALFIHERSGGSEAVYDVEVIEPSITKKSTIETSPSCITLGNSYTIQM